MKELQKFPENTDFLTRKKVSAILKNLHHEFFAAKTLTERTAITGKLRLLGFATPHVESGEKLTLPLDVQI